MIIVSCGLFKIINKNKKIFERLVLINATVNNIEKKDIKK